MTFNSLTFLIFFCIVAALMALSNLSAVAARVGDINRIRHIILLLASYVFYGWWNWKCCLLMIALTAVAYQSANGYSKSRKKIWVYIGVIFPLVVLGFFKYYNFFVQSFCDAFGIARAGTLRILLPVGISFYTFQSLSYTIDVYRGKIQPEDSFLRLSLYVAFFPQLVAGPIVKAGEFLPQLHEERTISLKNLELGVQYFAFGLFKKVVLADNVSVFVDAVHANPAKFSWLSLLLSVYVYGLQIYFDFSGYSDMAVGCAKCLGYELPRNFNLPYLSKNVSEFWKRWHISLSTWLQEYVYISLGGNRRGQVITYVNLMLTMTIGGLWHGAAWTYVVWGALHGVALCVHKLYSKQMKKLCPGKTAAAPGIVLSVFVTYTWVCFCLLVFRADSLSSAWRIFTGILCLQRGVTFVGFWTVLAFVLTAAAQGAAIIRSKREGTRLDGFYPTVRLDTVGGLAIFFICIGLILGLAYTGENPFIYFQF